LELYFWLGVVAALIEGTIKTAAKKMARAMSKYFM
jgi:hypothetical protein